MAEEKNKEDSPKKKQAVVFTAEQMQAIDEMFKNFQKDSKTSRSPNSAISMYDLRDPKKISTVKVSRFDGHWVLGFKDLQADPYKKTKQYCRIGIDPIRKLYNEPFVTLLLTDDGEKVEEKEVLLLTYMENRDTVSLDVLDVKEVPHIHDHGILGNTGAFAVAIDQKGNPESRPTIKAESKSIDREFKVHPEGFKEAVWYITDFLG